MSKFMMIILLLSIIHLTQIACFTSNITNLFEFEGVLISELEQHIHQEENNLILLRKALHKYQREHTEAADAATYLSNPMNIFLLMKRLTIEWEKVRQITQLSFGFNENMTKLRNSTAYPVIGDLVEAAITLMVMQTVHSIPVSDIADGVVNGVRHSKKMTAEECFEVGLVLYETKQFHLNHSILWFNEAIVRVEKEQIPTVEKVDVLEYLAISQQYLGDTEAALETINKLNTLAPHKERTLENLPKYADDERVPIYNDTMLDDYILDDSSYFPDKYCSGKSEMTPLQSSKLFCKYTTNDSPFLKIAPFKVEEISLDPYILQFHEVISDHEIDVIKKIAEPMLAISRTLNDNSSRHRIGETAFLQRSHHKVIKRLEERIADMTGLSTANAEQFQVVKYTVGGYYKSHLDESIYYKNVLQYDFRKVYIGGRIATVLFYLHPVTLGGRLVFSKLRHSVEPLKGTALVWHNFHRMGTVNPLLRHEACPVFIGAKWGLTLWLHEVGNEFRRPCALTPDDPFPGGSED